MNGWQRGVLIGAVFVIFVMLLFPPVSHYGGPSAGYSLIFSVRPNQHVNSGLLVVQWVGVIIVVGLLYLIFRGKA